MSRWRRWLMSRGSCAWRRFTIGRKRQDAGRESRAVAPLIAKGAEQKADLVVLPETLTYYQTGLSYADCAEPIPGPSSDYFGQLAKKHELYIRRWVARGDRHLVYNVAVLLAPTAAWAGKYRKVCLPRSEIEGGIQPGSEYRCLHAVWQLGMMVATTASIPKWPASYRTAEPR